MALMDDIRSVLPELQAAAEDRMTETCRITRDTGSPSIDPDTGQIIPGVVTVYEGPCRVRMTSTVVSPADAQSQLLTQQQATLSLPVKGSEGVHVDDLAEIVSAEFDAALVGSAWRVSGRHMQSQSTARRFPLELTS